MRTRLGLAMVLSALIFPLVDCPGVAGTSSIAFVWRCLAESLVGMSLGIAASLVIAGARQAGDVVGAQLGLSAASLFDPEAGDGQTPLGHLYGLIALAVFLGLQGPLQLVGALIESYRTLPVGSVAFSEQSVSELFGRVGGALGLAVRAAAPAALAVLLAGVAVGWIARSASAVQIMTLALPIRVVAGLVVVLVSLGILIATLDSSWCDLLGAG
jgi:flagellar biosynthetic protein FliR